VTLFRLDRGSASYTESPIRQKFLSTRTTRDLLQVRPAEDAGSYFGLLWDWLGTGRAVFKVPQAFFPLFKSGGFFRDRRNAHAGREELSKQAQAGIEGVNMALNLLPVGYVFQLDVASLA